MAISFNVTKKDWNAGNGSGVHAAAASSRGVWTWDGTTLTERTTSTAFDYFTNSVAVGEKIYFSTYAKTNKIWVYVGTARNGTVTLVWEYYKDNYDGTATWTAFTPTDASNGFTQTGERAITIPIATMPDATCFNKITYAGTDGFTSSIRPQGFMFRCRVSASSGATEGGAQSTQVMKWDDYTIHLSDGYDTGTFEAGANFTATDTGKSWTTNILADRYLKILTGTGAGQIRRIVSNTGTVITVSKQWTTNPSSDSTYSIFYNFADIYAADVAGSWGVVTNEREFYNIKAHIRQDAGGHIGDVKKNIQVGAAGYGWEWSNAASVENVFGAEDNGGTQTKWDMSIFHHASNMAYSYLQGNLTIYGGSVITRGWHGWYTQAVATTIVALKNTNFSPEQGVFGGKMTAERVNVLSDGKNSSFYIMTTPDSTFTDMMFSQSLINANPNYFQVFDACKFDIATTITGTATSGGASTLADTTKNWEIGALNNRVVRITAGTGVGQERTILSNTATEITVTVAWATNPDSTSVYSIAQAWRTFGNPTGSSANNTYLTVLKNCTIADPSAYLSNSGGNVLFRCEALVDWTFDLNVKDTTGSDLEDVRVEVRDVDNYVKTWIASGTYMSAAALDGTTWGGTSFDVLDGTKLTDETYIRIDREAMKVTNIATNTITVDRAQLGTFLNKHNPAAPAVRTDIAVYNQEPYVTTDASGNIPQQLLTQTNYHFFETGTPAPENDAAKHTKTYNPYTVKVRKYGYNFQILSKSFTAKDVSGVVLAANSNLVANYATAVAYTGITMDGVAKTITVTGTRTVQELYDFTQAWAYDNIQYDEPITTSDGVTFTLTTGWSISVSGSLTSLTKEVVGTVAVTGSGLFEDKTGAMKAIGGSTYYASHFWHNIINGVTSANIENAVVAYIDTDNDVDRTYNTSWTAGGLLTNASGLVEGYTVYQIDANEYPNQTLQVGEYDYNWVTIPKTITGSLIGTSAAPEVVRMTPATDKTLTKANALSVSGVTVTGATKIINLNHDDLTDVNDNLKARQCSTSTIESGVKGFMNYYLYGRLMVKDGTTYTGLADWVYNNYKHTETGTFKTGIITFDTPSVITLDVNAATMRFTATGTYDFRTTTLTGTVDLTNTSGNPVTVQVYPGTSYTNTGPTITVEESIGIVINISGMAAGSRYQLYDVTNGSELANAVSATGTEALPFVYTDDFTARLRVKLTGASTAKKWYETTMAVGVTGASVIVSQTDDSVYATNGINGATVTECAITGTNVYIEVDDPDNTTTWGRIYNWYQYYLFTEAGIREQDGDWFYTLGDAGYYWMDATAGFKVKNMDLSNPLAITGAVCVPTSGVASAILDPTGGSILANTAHATVVTGGSSGGGATAEEVRIEMDANSQIAKDAKQAKLNTF